MLALDFNNYLLFELIDSSPLTIFILSEEREIVRHNNAFLEFIEGNDLTKEELLDLIAFSSDRLIVKKGLFTIVSSAHDLGKVISFVPDRNTQGSQILSLRESPNCVYFEEESLVYLSPSLVDELGYAAYDLKKLNQFESIIYPSDQDRFLKLIDRTLSNKKVSRTTLRLYSKQRELKSYEFRTNSGINNTSAKQYTLIELLHVQPDERKFQYEDRFDLLLENTNDFLIIYENDIIKHVSSSFAKLGHDPSKIRTLYDIESLVHQEEIIELRSKVVADRRKHKTHSVYVFRIVAKNGNCLWYETTVKRSFHPSGEIKSLIGFYRDITEKKTAEDKIIASQEYLEKLTNAVTDALYVLDLDTFNYTFYNKSFSKTLGYSPEELRLNAPRFLTDIVHHDDRERILEIRKALVQGEKQFHDLTFRIKASSGRGYKTLQSKLYPFRFDGSTKNEVICFTQDVTNQLEVQKEMSEIKTKYQLAVESSSSGGWEYEIQTGKLYVDDKVKSILGYTVNEPIESLKAWEEKIYPDDYRWVKKTIREYVEKKSDSLEIAYRVIHKAGIVRWILTKGKSIDAAKNGGFKVVGTHTDITELKEYELALSASEENYRDLAESLSDVFLALNKNLVFTYWNKACEKIFKVSATEAIGRKMYEVLPYFAGSDIEKAILTSLIRQKVNTTIFQRKDSKHIYEVTTYPSKTGVSLFAKNITHKITYEEELIASRRLAEEALKTKEEFMSVMSHEIRTPLNAIVGLTHLLMENSPKQDQIETINTLKFSGDNLLVLVNDILDFSKIQAGKIELVDTVFDLHTLSKNLKNTYEAQASQKGVDLTLDLINEPPRYILGDKVRLTQILNNLLNNALKFTSQGKVSVTIEKKRETADTVSILFTINDTGIGIDQKDQAKIFDPFQQASKTTSRKFGGTGLGLSIIKNLVELQNGTVVLKSEPGVGSKFKVTLPFKKSTQEAHELLVSENEIYNDYDDLQDIRLLYVDDVATNQFLMSGFCARWNIQLDKAMNGFEALEKVKEKEYDCILMDIQMPEIDGYETSRRIRKLGGDHYKNVPIIAYTAEVSESGKLNVDLSGMNDLLTKPVDPKELFRKINKYSGKTVKENKVKSKLKEDRLSISFSDLDDLYSDSPDPYLEFLTHLEDESAHNYTELVKSIKNNDSAAFNIVKHKMQASLKIINYNTLISYLEDIKKEFKEDQVASQYQEILSKIEQFYDYIVNKVASKKEELYSSSAPTSEKT